MTQGVVNGTNLRIYIGGTAIARATTCALNASMETREILDKDSPGQGWVEIAPGRRRATLSTSGLVCYDSANIKVSTLFNNLKNGTVVVVRYTTDETGDSYWEGSGLITSFGLNAEVQSNATYSAEFAITGELQIGTES